MRACGRTCVRDQNHIILQTYNSMLSENYGNGNAIVVRVFKIKECLYKYVCGAFVSCSSRC